MIRNEASCKDYCKNSMPIILYIGTLRCTYSTVHTAKWFKGGGSGIIVHCGEN
jgi:hypothetical protein